MMITQEYVFKVSDPIQGVRELGETVIIYTTGANPIKVKDVAQAFPSYGEIRNIHRINGQPTISLSIFKEPGTSTLKVGKAVKRRLEEIKKSCLRNWCSGREPTNRELSSFSFYTAFLFLYVNKN